AAEEEAQVAAALDRVEPFLRAAREQPQKLEVKDFDDLTVGERGRILGRRRAHGEAAQARYLNYRLWTLMSTTCNLIAPRLRALRARDVARRQRRGQLARRFVLLRLAAQERRLPAQRLLAAQAQPHVHLGADVEPELHA